MVNEQRIIEEFQRLASIESPSFREGEIARYLAQKLDSLGASVEFDSAGEAIGGETGNLIARFPARGKEGLPFLLSAHMDTVEPAAGVKPILRDGVFYSAGETILGADDKCGITEILEAIQVVQEQEIPHGPLEVVITICEEQGLMGAKELDLSRLQSTMGVALDTCGVDCVTYKAPGANRMTFTIEGIESHAGIAPESGLSAVRVASRAIDRMPLGRIDEETTANIGTINGGVADNIVPKLVTVTGEARSHDSGKLAAQTEAMVNAFTQAAIDLAIDLPDGRKAARVEAKVQPEYPIMAVPEDAPVMKLILGASDALERPCEVMVGGGGSDANIFSGGGIDTVILGSGMTDVHSVDESVSVSDMVRVSELLVEMLKRAWNE